MIRVTITRALGSTPREAGATMHVTPDAATGSIGGGALEHMAIEAAHALLASGEAERALDIPLGPEIGQCCGGRVSLTLTRVAAEAPELPRPPLLIFGAGHVGRALARAALPVLAPTLIDQRAAELARAPGVPQRLSALPEADLRAAPTGAAVVIATHDHALDFALALEALRRPGLAYAGMIGSATKRAAFARLARAEGVEPAPLVCPIGAGFAPDKRPEVIAAFTLAEILARLLKAPPCT